MLTVLEAGITAGLWYAVARYLFSMRKFYTIAPAIIILCVPAVGYVVVVYDFLTEEGAFHGCWSRVEGEESMTSEDEGEQSSFSMTA